MSSTLDPLGVALRVTQILDGLDILHTIGGSIASSMAGEPRSTIDIDIVAAIEARHVATLVDLLEPEFYVDAQALARAVTGAAQRESDSP